MGMARKCGDIATWECGQFATMCCSDPLAPEIPTGKLGAAQGRVANWSYAIALLLQRDLDDCC